MQLLQDTVTAIRDAEMHETLAVLVHGVFQTGRALEVRSGGRMGVKMDLTPFAELVLLELRDIADSAYLTALKDERGLAAVSLAGF